MTYSDTLWLFFTLVFGIILVPGMDMILVLSNALTGGRRAGFTTTAGIMVGGVVHTVYAVIGVGAVIRFVPGLLDGLLLTGALYIGWIGFSLLRSSARLGTVRPAEVASGWVCFRRGLLTCLLNPKAYLFMLAVFPQFLKPAFGGLAAQASVLSAITAATQLAIYGSVALAADRSRSLMSGHPRATSVVGRLVGLLLMLIAVAMMHEAYQSFSS
jgi:threonine/homoserine/homoserine lactone efflux protein